MTTVPSATSPTQTTGTTQKKSTDATAGTGMDYNAFLQLLVAEMKNQDPTNPTDSTQYMAQFASFSNVEQAIQTNKKLDSLMTVSALTQASSIIGRTATSADGTQSGVVGAMRITDQGPTAILTDGTQLVLGNGTTVE